MARSSPAVGRVVSVLNHLAQYPQQSFTLTDLITTLKLNRATCHALLAGLVDEGYLYKTNDRSYVLGPALVPIGRAVIQNYSPLRIARSEMLALADDLQVVCSMLHKEGYDSVVEAQAIGKSRSSDWVETSMRRFLRPPFGGVYFVRSADAEIQEFLDQCDPAPTAQDRKEFLNSIEFARKHGFLPGVRNPDYPVRWDAPELFFSKERFALILQTEIQVDKSYDVVFLTAPVFTGGGDVAFTISLSNFSQPVRGDKVRQIGRHLRKVCDRIGTYLKEDAMVRLQA